MKKIFFTAAVLAAVCIGFIGCANAAGGGQIILLLLLIIL